MANPSKVLSRVTEIASFGDGVYKVVFEVPPRYTRYLPGQFLHLTLEEFDPTTGFWPESRVFSIASAPRLDHVTIVYSVKGQYTKRMEAELFTGKEVWLKFPYGDFVIDQGADSFGPLALVAGGTGISPYLPFLTGSRDRARTTHLFYGVRRPEHVLFRQELQGLSGSDGFFLHLFVEEGDDPSMPFQRGRLSIQQVMQTLGVAAAESNYYLSGPPGMIRSFKTDLVSRSIAAAKIHIDEWE